MIEIPVNDDTSNKDLESQLVCKILEGLKTKTCIDVYWNELPNKEIALKVGSLFAKKKYHVQAYYFVESWKGIGGMQKIKFSKKPLQELNARLVYSETIR